ncbi:MAG: 2-hydroxychromene-2-carboxylate isomerase [Alphaproteobacteria bacterium]|nr:2-hydroxychromene-2-carboxylate isomerase [Alphaproteobacteria bacterium]
MTIDFYFDVVCPYAWVASQRLEWLARSTGHAVRHRPILLGGVLRAVGNVDVPMDAMAPPKAAYTVRDVQRQAERAGLGVSYPDDHPRRTVEAMRLLTAAPDDVVPRLAQDLWKAYWTDHERLTDRAVLERLARPYGVDVAAIDDPDVKEALRANTEAAVQAGVFGVPTLASGGFFVWGSDRLDSFATDLGAPLQPSLPRGPIEVFHDFSSPYSYLGVMALLESGADITLRPFLLGALFKAIGTPIIPLRSFNAAKQRWAEGDMVAQARYRGQPFRFTDHFPLRTVTALRVALVEPATTAALYRAAWAHNRDIADEAVLVALLDEAGFDGADLVARTADPAVKEALRENTDRAVRIGIPGAPTFVRPDGELFWGQDRLDVVAWREAGGA